MLSHKDTVIEVTVLKYIFSESPEGHGKNSAIVAYHECYTLIPLFLVYGMCVLGTHESPCAEQRYLQKKIVC